MPADPETVVKNVGRRVAELRLEKGMTQAQLAEKIGVATQWISRVENGGANLTLYSLAKIGKALDVEPDEFWVRPESVTRKAKRGRPAKGSTRTK